MRHLVWGVEIYPSPTDELIKISVPSDVIPCSYQILNTNGQVVGSGNIKKEESIISIKELNRGIYFVQLKQTNEVYKFGS